MKASDLKIFRKIGQGGFGSVYLAKCENSSQNLNKGQLAVVKVIDKRREESIRREVTVIYFFLISEKIILLNTR